PTNVVVQQVGPATGLEGVPQGDRDLDFEGGPVGEVGKRGVEGTVPADQVDDRPERDAGVRGQVSHERERQELVAAGEVIENLGGDLRVAEKRPGNISVRKV